MGIQGNFDQFIEHRCPTKYMDPLGGQCSLFTTLHWFKIADIICVIVVHRSMLRVFTFYVKGLSFRLLASITSHVCTLAELAS